MQDLRPDGSAQIKGGRVMLAAGIVIFMVGVFWDVRTYPSLNLDDLAAKWCAIYLGGATLTVSFFLFIAGWIIRAIYFLPGREAALPAAEQEGNYRPTVDLNEFQGEPADNRWFYLTVGGVLCVFAALAIYNQYHKDVPLSASDAYSSGTVIENANP